MKITEIPHPGDRYIRSDLSQQWRDQVAEQWRAMRRDEGHAEARRVWRTERDRCKALITKLFYTMPETVSPFGLWLLANEENDNAQ